MKFWILKHNQEWCRIFTEEPHYRHGYWTCDTDSDFGFALEPIERWLGYSLPLEPELTEIEAPKPKTLCTWLPEEKR